MIAEAVDIVLVFPISPIIGRLKRLALVKGEPIAESQHGILPQGLCIVDAAVHEEPVGGDDFPLVDGIGALQAAVRVIEMVEGIQVSLRGIVLFGHASQHGKVASFLLSPYPPHNAAAKILSLYIGMDLPVAIVHQGIVEEAVAAGSEFIMSLHIHASQGAAEGGQAIRDIVIIGVEALLFLVVGGTALLVLHVDGVLQNLFGALGGEGVGDEAAILIVTYDMVFIAVPLIGIMHPPADHLGDPTSCGGA